MRRIVLPLATLLAVAAAGCAAGGPYEAQDDVNAGDQCPDDTSAYHEGGVGGEATSDPPPEPVPPTQRMGGPYCPDGIDATNTSTMETIDTTEG